MNKRLLLQKLFADQYAAVEINWFIVNLLLAVVLSFILGRIYTRYGTSLSNRKMFANNFMIITLTTMFIITVVKSSLALSLGLVGALSIVRFRTAIKEPEELAYLFLAISIGLGFGAGQRAITIVAFILICGVIILQQKSKKYELNNNLYLTVANESSPQLELDQIVETIKKHCSVVDMKRFDEGEGALEVSFFIEVDDFIKIQSIKKDLQSLSKSMSITFLDHKRDF